MESAFVFVTDRLRELGVPYEDGAKTLEPNMDKLRADQVDVVIGMELEADRHPELAQRSWQAVQEACNSRAYKRYQQDQP
ncbi:hypothetical protein ABT364_12605 [Massilia sp. SR12]